MLSDHEIERALNIFAAAGASADVLAQREITLRTGVSRVESNLARTTLLVDHEPLPWARYAAGFARRMPPQLRQLQEETAERASHTDLTDQIARRLGQHRRVLRIGRYIPPRGVRSREPTVEARDGDGAPSTTDIVAQRDSQEQAASETASPPAPVVEVPDGGARENVELPATAMALADGPN